MPKISKDIPLSEITLRSYEKPNASGRELTRKICLSLGLLQPGDSRDIIVDVLDILLESSKEKKMLSTNDITKKVIASRKKYHLSVQGTAHSNIRRQLRRLREILLVEKVKNSYRITEFSTLREIFEEKILKYYVASITERIYEYMEKS